MSKRLFFAHFHGGHFDTGVAVNKDVDITASANINSDIVTL